MARVLIVGAGPAGASLALLLAQRGLEVTLLERQREFDREFRGEVLMPSGLEALELLGLGDALEKMPIHPQESLSVFLNRRHVFTQPADRESFRGHFPAAVSQPAMLELIVSEARKFPNFVFEPGATVKDLLRENGRIVGVRARIGEGERELRADLLIGADGRASVVRKQGGFTSSHVSPPLDIVWCKVPCPEDWDGFHLYAGRGHLLLGYRSWDDHLQLAWIILKGTFGELKSRGIDQWIEEMAGHVTPSLAAHIRLHANAVKKPFLLDSVCDCVDRWSVPGALLIGDAAHTMSPVGGQGVNIALRDTIVAANHLVPVLKDGPLDLARLDAALVEIERERMPEVRVIQRMQGQPPKIALSRAWWGEPLRRAMSVLLSREAVRARIGGRASAFPLGVTDVELKV
jgi:2-polyprenyl-6-methoxyphenol hydroxylase-like FAD-dependent oxidoreductase